MVQLYVSTELQLDYHVDQPLQFPAPLSVHSTKNRGRTRDTQARNNVGAERAKHNEAARVSGRLRDAQASNPQPSTVLDNNGLFNIFYDTFYIGNQDTQLICLYQTLPSRDWIQEIVPPPWSAGSTPSKRIGPLAIKDPYSGIIHVVYSYQIGPDNGTNNKFLSHMEVGRRFTAWNTLICPTVDAWDEGNEDWTIGCMDADFNENNDLIVTLSYNHATYTGPPNYYVASRDAGTITWTPAASNPTVNTMSLTDKHGNVTSIKYSRYQAQKLSPDKTAQAGFLFIETFSSFASVTRRIFQPFQSSSFYQESVVFPPDPSVNMFFRNPCWCTFSDRDAAPLGWVLAGDTVYFIRNDSSLAGYSLDNLTALFTDVPPGRHVVQVSGLIVDSKTPSDTSTIDFDVHTFALFRVDDNTFELWHTCSVPGGVQEVADGIFDIPADNWASSGLVTRDIFCILDGLTGPLSPPFFNAIAIENEPNAVVINRNRYIEVYAKSEESGAWTSTEVRGTINGKSPKVRESKIYFVEITALEDDGSLLPGVGATLGSDTRLLLTCAGQKHLVEAGQSFNVPFSESAKLTVSLEAQDNLIPSSFWIHCEGMDDDVKVDIQPGPNKLHDKLAELGTKDYTDLRHLKTQDGQLLVPADIPDDHVNMAQSALQNISKVITGDVSNDISHRLHVSRRTSSHVARTRKGRTAQSCFGKLKPIPGFAFVMVFRPEASFRVISSAEAKKLKQALLKGSANGFFSDIGDFFSNVANGVAEVYTIVIEAGKEAYEAVVHFKEQVMKAATMVIEFVSQAAELAVVVFDFVKTTFEKIYMWLAFLFNWGDFKATAAVFEQSILSAGPKFDAWIENVAKVATSSAFQKLQDQVDGLFDSLINQFGTETFANVSQPIPIDAKSRQLLLSGDKVSNDNLGTGFEDVLASMPSSASWLLEKVLGLIFGGDDGVDIGEQGMKAFDQTIDTITSAFNSVFSGSAFDDAVSALLEFFTAITSTDAFTAKPVAALLKLLKAFSKIIINLLKTVVNAVLDFFRYVSTLIFKIFKAGVNNVALEAIYFLVTQDTNLTWAKLCSLVMAIPYTIMYKIITNSAPYGENAEHSELNDWKADWRLANGILQILKPIYLSLKTVDSLIDNNPAFAAATEGFLRRFRDRCHALLQSFVCCTNKTMVQPFSPTMLAALGVEQAEYAGEDAGEMDPKDVFDALSLICSAVQGLANFFDMVGGQIAKRGREDNPVLVRNRTNNNEIAMMSVDCFAGFAGVLSSAIGFTFTEGGPSTADKLVLVGNVMNSTNSFLAILDKQVKEPKQKFALLLVRTSLCWTAGGLFIGAYEHRNDSILLQITAHEVDEERIEEDTNREAKYIDPK